MISLFTAKKVKEKGLGKSNERKTLEVGGSDVFHVLPKMIVVNMMIVMNMMMMSAMSNKIVECRA
jgi:hypothetical protein